MQSGRTMMEMLGVLAIIGILSIGGLVGYSKAVERYRINETIKQITYISFNTRDMFKNEYNYKSLDSTVTAMSDTSYANRILADKVKIFPPSLSSANYMNVFKGNTFFYSSGRFKSGDSKAFIVTFHDIPKSSCLEIATREWPGDGLVAIRIRGTSTVDNILRDSYDGSCVTQVSEGNALICAADLPIEIPQAAAACNSHDNNKISWKFY